MINPNTIAYMNGFGNEHESEALRGALPKGCFNPQRAPYQLYTEQFSTTAFTAPRHSNRRSWLYRIRPSVVQSAYKKIALAGFESSSPNNSHVIPDPLRWNPLPALEKPTSFLSGIQTFATNGDLRSQTGSAVHLYDCNQSMEKSFFCNADGEMIVVPQSGALLLWTEMGIIHIAPGEVAVIPRGIKFKVELTDREARGYIGENYGAPMQLPERGPVGSNGFANDRDFQYPTAWFEDKEDNFELVTKFCGQFFSSQLNHSPLDVVAWTGNSAPYKYDLAKFNVINTVSFDHPDPSIFTVLTSPSDTLGTANVDFVIFPPRWMVAENTFRPPWFHRNIMSEFMGLITGVYDAKEEGFVPGGASLHNSMTPHGPEAAVHKKASEAELKPEKYQNTLAFMFESRYVYVPTQFALNTNLRQKDYSDCWQTLRKQFNGQHS